MVCIGFKELYHKDINKGTQSEPNIVKELYVLAELIGKSTESLANKSTVPGEFKLDFNSIDGFPVLDTDEHRDDDPSNDEYEIPEVTFNDDVSLCPGSTFYCTDTATIKVLDIDLNWN